jgi:carbamoyltransferase
VYILGINSVFHESSACLLKEGKILATAEEERFNRIKRGKVVGDNSDELPLNAVRYCLDSTGISLKEVEHIGYSFNPDIRSPLTGKIFFRFILPELSLYTG